MWCSGTSNTTTKTLRCVSVPASYRTRPSLARPIQDMELAELKKAINKYGKQAAGPAAAASAAASAAPPEPPSGTTPVAWELFSGSGKVREWGAPRNASPSPRPAVVQGVEGGRLPYYHGGSVQDLRPQRRALGHRLRKNGFAGAAGPRLCPLGRLVHDVLHGKLLWRFQSPARPAPAANPRPLLARGHPPRLRLAARRDIRRGQACRQGTRRSWRPAATAQDRQPGRHDQHREPGGLQGAIWPRPASSAPLTLPPPAHVAVEAAAVEKN